MCICQKYLHEFLEVSDTDVCKSSLGQYSVLPPGQTKWWMLSEYTADFVCTATPANQRHLEHSNNTHSHFNIGTIIG